MHGQQNIKWAEMELHFFITSALDVMSGHFHAPAALHPEISHWYPRNGELLPTAYGDV
jgi:hypothetical protein